MSGLRQPPPSTWEVGFVLPNLSIARTFEAAHIALVPADDLRVQDICARWEDAQQLVGGFRDHRGDPVAPAVLIAAEPAPPKVWSEAALVAFRNVVALAVIPRGWAAARSGYSPPGPLFSDYFDFHPTTVGRGGSLLTDSPALLSYGHPSVPFLGLFAPHLGRLGPETITVDDYLLAAMTREWDRRFVTPATDARYSRALFRSLEMAYHASATPFKNHSTINDYGVSISLWVSAFEILAHPRPRVVNPAPLAPVRGRSAAPTVNWLEVNNLIGQHVWHDSRLNERRWKARYSGRTHRLKLAQRLYRRLYDARNDFLHGNDIGGRVLDPFPHRRGQQLPIWQFAPVVYRTALYAFLQRRFPGVPTDEDEALRWAFDEGAYEDCLLQLL